MKIPLKAYSAGLATDSVVLASSLDYLYAILNIVTGFLGNLLLTQSVT